MQSEVATKPLFITSIDVLPFSTFIECDCDGKYELLVKEGQATSEDLRAAWMNIRNQCYEYGGKEEMMARIELIATIEIHNTKVLQVTALLFILNELKNIEITDFPIDLINEISIAADCLRMWGYEFAFNLDTLDEDMDKVHRWLSTEKLKLGLARQKYEDSEAARETSDDSGGNKRVMYVQNLLTLEQHRKYPIRAHEITTLQYFLMVQELINYNEAQAKALN
jgi:hypothetical protein